MKSSHDADHGRSHRQIIAGAALQAFGSIPHADLLKSVARRIVDRRVLHLIKTWLECPVEEHISGLIDRVTGEMHAQVIARPLYDDKVAPSSTLYHVHCKATDRTL